MTFGAYISQAIVRYNTPKGPGTEHGNPTDGYEVDPGNIEAGLKNLGLTYEMFDTANVTKP
jgi:hypothetical protein